MKMLRIAHSRDGPSGPDGGAADFASSMLWASKFCPNCQAQTDHEGFVWAWAEQAVYKGYQLEAYAKPRPLGYGGSPFWMTTAFALLAGMFVLKHATTEIDEHGLGQGWTMYITAAILSRESPHLLWSSFLFSYLLSSQTGLSAVRVRTQLCWQHALSTVPSIRAGHAQPWLEHVHRSHNPIMGFLSPEK